MSGAAIGPIFRKFLGWATVLLLAVGAAACAPFAMLGTGQGTTAAPQSLTVEFRSDPLGIDAAAPRLSWKLVSDRRGAAQTAYQVRVSASPQALDGSSGSLWDTGRVESDQSVLLPYAGPALQSGHRYWWQVRLWDERGTASPWSTPAFWEMGLLSASDWSAQWIEPLPAGDSAHDSPAPLLRKAFHVDGKLRSARAYVTSHGLYEFYLNGRRVGDALLTPGWTSYGKRLPYQSYDVTALLDEGDNAAGVMLGDGWYRGQVAGKRDRYGTQLGLLLQLQLEYADGRRETIVSDASWKSSTGPILQSGIYAGENYDARLEQPGWSSAGFDDHAWSGVTTPAPDSGAVLFAAVSPPVRRQEELKPLRIFKTPAGDTVADLGQNMVGRVRLRVQGPAGTVVRLRHAEVLDQNGNFYTDNLRTAAQEVRYTLRGQGEEVYEPHFTYQGFRYVAIDGYPGTLGPDSITGVVMHADMARSGEFQASNPQLNQLQHNIVWGEKGNFLVVPSDCPQRDERLGWTGDAEVFSPTAAYNMDVSRFLAAWLGDVAADQLANGSVPWVVPDILGSFGGQAAAGAAGWGDAATIIPWNLYLAYGDRGVLAAQYSSMARWVDYEQQRAGARRIWSGDFQFGDWLDFGSEQRGRLGATPADLVATAYFAHSAELLSRAAQVLGKSEDAARYARLFAEVRAAFQQQFVSADGRVGGGTQTAYVLALDFDLLPEAQRPAAALQLAQAVREAGHLTTGFLGTPHLLQVLSRFGYLDDAYRLLLHQDFPSWLYPIGRGATTIWERWDGIKPDGSFENRDMNSFNHYAYGAVGEWMYQTIAGIDLDPAAPGYKHILIQPQPGGGLSAASGSYETPYGTVQSDWSEDGGRMALRLRVPPNTTAQLILPDARLAEVREGNAGLDGDPGILAARQQAATVVIELGAGSYRFSYPLATH